MVCLELLICCYFLQFIVNKLHCCFGILFSSHCALKNTTLRLEVTIDKCIKQMFEYERKQESAHLTIK